MDYDEYMDEKKRIAKETNRPVANVGVFEPFPRDKRPYGREDLIMKYIKKDRCKANADFLKAAETALIDEMTPEDRAAREKRMGIKKKEDEGESSQGESSQAQPSQAQPSQAQPSQAQEPQEPE